MGLKPVSENGHQARLGPGETPILHADPAGNAQAELAGLWAALNRRFRQSAVRPITKRHGLGMFACAPGDRFCLGDLHFFRLQPGPFVRPVAERLAFRTPASAPPIGARLHFLNNR